MTKDLLLEDVHEVASSTSALFFASLREILVGSRELLVHLVLLTCLQENIFPLKVLRLLQHGQHVLEIRLGRAGLVEKTS